MGKLALVATIKTVAGKRDEYLKHLRPTGADLIDDAGALAN
jgi:hypothetical protein